VGFSAGRWLGRAVLRGSMHAGMHGHRRAGTPHACARQRQRQRQSQAGTGRERGRTAGAGVRARAPVRVACMRRGRSWIDALLVRLVGVGRPARPVHHHPISSSCKEPMMQKLQSARLAKLLN